MESQFQSNPKAAQNNGTTNPYYLAEQVAGRRIDWKKVEDKPALLESTLGTPYEELFDPKYDGPLYLGLRLNEKGVLERFRSPLLDVRVSVDVNDLEVPVEHLSSEVKTLGDLGNRFRVKDVAELKVTRTDVSRPGQIALSIRIPEKDRLQNLARIFTPDVVNSVAYDPELKGKEKEEWTPENAEWRDVGDYFHEASEFFDPVQGAVANCYFIAALSAVAWATPYKIAHLSRATGYSQQDFTNMIRFYKPDSNGQIDQEIEVTDRVPVNAVTGRQIYCRSSERGELWPALYEKAFAKLITGTTSDRPDITATGWGDCIHATARLNGGQRHYYSNGSLSGDQIWDLVRSHSRGRRTFDPMTCWTHGTAPEGVDYSDANIVASHCYTILGWDYHQGKKYLLIRNPWGRTEGTVGNRGGSVCLFDISWWRRIVLANPDGTFAIEADEFKRHFAGLGFAA